MYLLSFIRHNALKVRNVAITHSQYQFQIAMRLSKRFSPTGGVFVPLGFVAGKG